MARLKFFIGICLSLTLFGIVFVVLYSLIFVTQPLNAISPIDQKFFELIVPIATFLTGTLSGIMLAGGDKDAQREALKAATRPTTVSPAPGTPTKPSMPLGGFGASPTGGFGASPTGGFGASPTGGFGASPTGGWGVPSQNTFGGPASVSMSASGKPMPMQPPEPEL